MSDPTTNPTADAEVIPLRPAPFGSAGDDIIANPTGSDAPVRDAASAADIDTSFEVQFDPEPDAEPEPVDDGIGYLLDDPDGDAYPVIPENLRSAAGVGEAIGRHARRLAHRAAFHGVRAPRYALLAVLWGTVGLWRLIDRQLKWWWVSEQDYLRSLAIASGDSREWYKLHREVKDTRRVRGTILAGQAFAVLAALLLLVKLAPWWGWLAVAGVVVPWLAHLGRPEDHPIIVPAVTVPRFRLLNHDVVLRAYYAAGLGHPDKPNQQVTFETTMSRTKEGQGSQVKVVLPHGTGFDDVVKAKKELASGLDVAPSQVYLTHDPTSHRRHTLTVTDRDPLAVPAGKTPLLDCKPRNIWRPAPFGLDEHSRKVTLTLLWISILIGAQPRKGKTFSARLLALYAALDPSVRLSVVDGKNSPDWNKFAMVAYHFIRGTVPGRAGDPVRQLIDALSEIKRHIIDTNDFLSTLSPEECPEGKLTEELCRRYPKRLFIWMLVMEEFQNYFELPDQDDNKQIAELLSFILAVGPSSGVILLSSSQKPSGVGAGDVQRLFNRYRDNHAVRFALRCGNRNVSDAILGGDAYSEGFDASALPVGKPYLGVGYLYGAADETPTVRTHLADHGDAEKILTAARRLRERAGTIAGYAAGEDTGTPDRDVLADVLAVFGSDPALHWTELAERLAGQIGDRWADVTAGAVSEQCRALGVPSVDVKRNGAKTPRKGCRKDAVQRAADTGAAG
ncbi:cell division protein FtsK [Actinomadura montaniterrae]|uniref:Cell division protein FtsK n=1 Tax=Actinomadura montaniterrae TaxID=1803903 RepID=A0A6L3W6H7_9ACTN|nr:cell division protein FtsK [Actinomadura montaniterrae]KAB2390498.1 cell division protein FtsK [Actinomadura montaniterrae]